MIQRRFEKQKLTEKSIKILNFLTTNTKQKSEQFPSKKSDFNPPTSNWNKLSNEYWRYNLYFKEKHIHSQTQRNEKPDSDLS